MCSRSTAVEPVHEVEHALRRVHRLAQQVQQARQRVDRDRAPRVERRLGDEHRERRLAGAHVALDPQAPARLEVRLDRAHVAAHRAHLVGGGPRDVAHGRAVEGDARVAPRDAPGEAPGARPRDPRGPAARSRWPCWSPRRSRSRCRRRSRSGHASPPTRAGDAPGDQPSPARAAPTVGSLALTARSAPRRSS